MKRSLAVLAAAAVAALVLLHPVAPPVAPIGQGSAARQFSALGSRPGAGTVAASDEGAPGWSSTEKRPGRGAALATHAMVYVVGEVVRPGVYAVRPEARIRDALQLAGGSKPGADLIAVNLAAHVRDGDQIVVPPRGAPETITGRTAHGHPRSRAHTSGGQRIGGPYRAAGGRHKRSRRNEPPPAFEVDLNTADAGTLSTIPGIGPGLAERIVAFRTANGPFASVDELLDVAGITEHRLDAILPYVIAR